MRGEGWNVEGRQKGMRGCVRRKEHGWNYDREEGED